MPMQESKMKLVFVSSPLRGDVKANQARAMKFCKFACEQGCSPLAPHLFFTQFLDDYLVSERTLGLEAGLEWLRRADEVWVFSEHGVSEGMQKELDLANALGKPVIFFDDSCKQIEDGGEQNND